MDQRLPAEIAPPGTFILEELEGRGWTLSDLATILNRPLQTISLIVNGKKAITPETAQEIGEAFGTGPEVWLNLESMWQLSKAAGPGGRVRQRAAVYEMAPVREMVRRKWIRNASSPEEIAEELKKHFGVESLDVMPQLLAAARSSVRGENDALTPAQWAWCCRARKVSSLVSARSYRKSAVLDAVSHLRSLMGEPEQIRQVPKVLSDAGVRLVVVEHLQHTRLDGAALGRDRTQPVIALSLRMDRIDNFWFTLMHELAHIVNDDGASADSEVCSTGDHVDDVESRANAMAAEWLVPRDRLESFILRTTPLYSSRKIANFASRLGVHPGIVVGQLKFRKELPWGHLLRLQVPIRDIARQSNISDGWGEVAPIE